MARRARATRARCSSGSNANGLMMGRGRLSGPVGMLTDSPPAVRRADRGTWMAVALPGGMPPPRRLVERTDHPGEASDVRDHGRPGALRLAGPDGVQDGLMFRDVSFRHSLDLAHQPLTV